MSNMFLFKSKKIPNYFRFSLFYFSRMIYNKNRLVHITELCFAMWNIHIVSTDTVCCIFS